MKKPQWMPGLTAINSLYFKYSFLHLQCDSAMMFSLSFSTKMLLLRLPSASGFKTLLKISTDSSAFYKDEKTVTWNVSRQAAHMIFSMWPEMSSGNFMRKTINFSTSVKSLIVCILFISTFFPLSFSLTPQVNTCLKISPSENSLFPNDHCSFSFSP